MRTELEFLISQYLDGTLPPLEAARVEEILATDASAREIFAEYQRLNASLRAMPQAQVDFDSFASSISTQLANEDLPLTTFRIGFTRVLQVSAIAASLLVVIGTAVMLFKQGKTEVEGPHVSIATNNPAIQISGPTIEVSPSPAVAVISIGPAPGYADASRHSYEAVVSRPTRVVIASGTRQAQDNGDLPY
jgi:hypothetical protein